MERVSYTETFTHAKAPAWLVLVYELHQDEERCRFHWPGCNCSLHKGHEGAHYAFWAGHPYLGIASTHDGVLRVSMSDEAR